jgi:hypothetical protein
VVMRRFRLAPMVASTTDLKARSPCRTASSRATASRAHPKDCRRNNSSISSNSISNRHRSRATANRSHPKECRRHRSSSNSRRNSTSNRHHSRATANRSHPKECRRSNSSISSNSISNRHRSRTTVSRSRTNSLSSSSRASESQRLQFAGVFMRTVFPSSVSTLLNRVFDLIGRKGFHVSSARLCDISSSTCAC